MVPRRAHCAMPCHFRTRLLSPEVDTPCFSVGRARVVSHIQSVMIVTKARDNQLTKLTRELALYLMKKPRNGKDRGLVV